MTSCRSRRFCPGKSVLKVMADVQSYRFEPERVPNSEDSENKEVNDRLEGTFWCSCERCESCQRKENVCCREQPEAENKMEGRILSLYCSGCSKWKNSFLCKLL